MPAYPYAKHRLFKSAEPAMKFLTKHDDFGGAYLITNQAKGIRVDFWGERSRAVKGRR